MVVPTPPALVTVDPAKTAKGCASPKTGVIGSPKAEWQKTTADMKNTKTAQYLHFIVASPP
jgi:hypothetical protein